MGYSSPALAGPAIADCQFANDSAGGMLAGDGGSISLSVLQEAEEIAVFEIHESLTLSAASKGSIAEVAGDLCLPAGLVLPKPVFELGIYDDPQFSLEEEEAKLIPSEYDSKSFPLLTPAQETYLMKEEFLGGHLESSPVIYGGSERGR